MYQSMLTSQHGHVIHINNLKCWYISEPKWGSRNPSLAQLLTLAKEVLFSWRFIGLLVCLLLLIYYWLELHEKIISFNLF